MREGFNELLECNFKEQVIFKIIFYLSSFIFLSWNIFHLLRNFFASKRINFILTLLSITSIDYFEDLKYHLFILISCYFIKKIHNNRSIFIDFYKVKFLKMQARFRYVLLLYIFYLIELKSFLEWTFHFSFIDYIIFILFLGNFFLTFNKNPLMKINFYVRIYKYSIFL